MTTDRRQGPPQKQLGEAEVQAALRAAVREALKIAGKRQSDLAAALGKTPVDVSRYLGTRGRMPRDWALIEKMLNSAGVEVEPFKTRYGQFWGLDRELDLRARPQDWIDPKPSLDADLSTDFVVDTHTAATGAIIEDARPTFAYRPRPRRLQAFSLVSAAERGLAPPTRPPDPNGLTTPASVVAPAPRPTRQIRSSRRGDVSPPPFGSRQEQGPARDLAATPATGGSGRRRIIAAAVVTLCLVAVGATITLGVLARNATPGGLVGVVSPALTSGAALRTLPSTISGQSRASAPAGSTLRATCAVVGDPVAGSAGSGQRSTTWLRLDDGLYVNAADVDTPGYHSIVNCDAGGLPLRLTGTG